MAGLSEHAAQSGVRRGAFRRDREQGRAAALSVQEWSPIGRGGESHDRGRLQYVSQCGGRLRGSVGRASQARFGGWLEGNGTSLETNVNKILFPTSGNDAAYSQKSAAGAEMDDGGRKELEAHWTRVCDRLRKENGDKAFQTWFCAVALGELKAGQLRLYAPTPVMHAIWHVIRERDPKLRVLYLTAESFVNRFIQALRTKNTNQFKELFRNVDVLMVDDVQFICGKEATQDEFFFTFNSLVEQNKQIVLSSEKPPSDLQDIEERMRSRLGAGLGAAIHSSTHALRLSILQTKAETARVPVPLAVLEFLAHKISTNMRELERALNRVVAHGQLICREITVEIAQDVLHDLLRQAYRNVTVDEIQQRVAAHYNIKLAEMSSPRRARSVARPRQVAMYLAKQLTTLSLPQIGKRFGNRDHTTVMHAVRKIEELKVSDLSIAEDVELLKRQLQG